MRSYKDSCQIEKLTTPELIHYRKYLKCVTKDMKSEIASLGKTWKIINDELRLRIDENELELIELENRRKNAETVEDFISLDLQ